MMIVEIMYRGTPQQVTLYDVWDIPQEQMVLPHNTLSEDVGKYALYTDGSRMLSKIYHKRGKFFNTSGGIYHIFDYVSVCRPKIRMSGYSGLLYSHEHIKVRRPNQNERAICEAFVEGNLPSNKRFTKRCALLVLERLQEHMNSRSINEEYIVDKLVKEIENSRNRGADRIEAIKIVARIGGVEIGGLNTVQNKRLPLFQQFNAITVQNQRRLSSDHEVIDIPTRKELEHAIDIAIPNPLTELLKSEPL